MSARYISDLDTIYNNSKTLVITGCSKSKAETDIPIPARELYTGQLFKFVKRYTDEMNFPLYVISAKYGLISSETTIERYDKVLRNAVDAELLRPQVEMELKKILPEFNSVLVIAGENYRRTLMRIADDKFIFLKTKGIGYTLHVLKNAYQNTNL